MKISISLALTRIRFALNERDWKGSATKMNLVGEKVVLRAIEMEDLEFLREMVNDPDMEHLVVGWSFPVSRYEQQKWYERTILDKLNLRFVIQNEDEKTIGLATLDSIDWKNRKAHHGMKLGAKALRGRGYGTDTVMTIMRYAFEELQLNRLDSSWFEYNMASQRLYTKCGWVVEGKVRQSVFKKNAYHDEIIVGVTRDDYARLLAQGDYKKGC